MNPTVDQGKTKARIVQLRDSKKTFPDGSKIIYAESDDRLVIYHKPAFGPNVSYVFHRDSTNIFVNGKAGTDEDKKNMLKLSNYFMTHAQGQDIVTLDVRLKEPF